MLVRTFDHCGYRKNRILLTNRSYDQLQVGVVSPQTPHHGDSINHTLHHKLTWIRPDTLHMPPTQVYVLMNYNLLETIRVHLSK